ncbi:MAG: hypothetical protein K8R69_09375 [Deltaproteobacteria bacterium]|nr:hypothetical protein [Deltaproteobacteria bacterium]
MKKSKFLQFLLWGLLLAGVVSCSGVVPGNNATVPAPVVELPSLQFPSSVSVDTNQLSGAPSQPQLALINIGDSLDSDIDRIQVASQFFLNFVDLSVLAPLAPLRIPRGTNVTTFEDAIVINTRVANIKIDFAPYQYDASGTGLNCSGNTAGLPICYRIWIDDVPTLAGLFLAIPKDDNPGIGQFKGLPLDDRLEGSVGSLYDHLDPAAISTEVFTAVNGFRELGHGLLDAITTQDVTFTTINFSFLENQNTTRDVARYRDDQNFISISQESTNPGILNYIAACGDLLTRLVIDSNICVNAGIDVTGIDFVDFATPADVTLPADFPVVPPFQDSPFHSQ